MQHSFDIKPLGSHFQGMEFSLEDKKLSLFEMLYMSGVVEEPLFVGTDSFADYPQIWL